MQLRLITCIVIGGVCLFGAITWVVRLKSSPPNLIIENNGSDKTVKSEQKSLPLFTQKSTPTIIETSRVVEVTSANPIVNALFSGLESADPEIRKQALMDIIQLDDRSLNPRLQQIADRTRDLAERAKILDAINFINLPDPDEYFASIGKTGRVQRASVDTNSLVNNPRHRRHQKQQPQLDSATSSELPVDSQPAQ